MIPLTLVTGDRIWVARYHVVSVAKNPRPELGSLVRMSNGDQWAVDESSVDIVSGWDIR